MKKLTLAALTAVFFVTPALAEHGGEHHGKRMEHFVKKIDTNADGNISRAEHDAFADKKFKKLDTDSDGNISAGEREEAKKRWEAKRAEWKAKNQQKSAE